MLVTSRGWYVKFDENGFEGLFGKVKIVYLFYSKVVFSFSL